MASFDIETYLPEEYRDQCTYFAVNARESSTDTMNVLTMIWDIIPDQIGIMTLQVSEDVSITQDNNIVIVDGQSSGYTFIIELDDLTEQATIIASPAIGYQFVKWMENGNKISQNASYTFSIKRRQSLTAVFAIANIIQRIVTLDVDPSGSGSVSGDGSYQDGSQVTITASPETGYKFVKWMENNSEISQDNPYVFTINNDRNLTAIFEAIMYTTNLGVTPLNSGFVTGSGRYKPGNQVTVRAVAKDGYQFVRWTENDLEVSQSNPYIFNISGDRNLTAVFEMLPEYTIMVSANPSEGGTVSGGGTYQKGTQVTVRAVAKDNYDFVEWIENGLSVSQDAEYSFIVTSDRNLTSIFAMKEPLSYYGVATPLNVARFNLAATSVGNYALFGGGMSNNGPQNIVDAYNDSLTHTTPTSLNKATYCFAATLVGNYALFGGGTYSTSYAYNNSLTRTMPTPLSVGRYYLAATSVGNYALFGGGDESGASYLSVVDAYDDSLTHTTPTTLNDKKTQLAATSVGNYALFGGGYYANNKLLSTVDAYDDSLTHTMPTPLSITRYDFAATSVGNYALFGGGNVNSSSVDAYDKFLTRTTPIALNYEKDSFTATSVGNYALFGGGSPISHSTTVDAYDDSLIRTTPTPLSAAREDLKATSVGNYALFGGGNGGSGNAFSVVDVYLYTLIRKEN